MSDLATRFADLLEASADKVRSLTVDRVDRYGTIGGMALAAFALALVASIMLVRGIFLAVSVPLGVTGAYAFFGGLFVIAGALVWAMRKRASATDDG